MAAAAAVAADLIGSAAALAHLSATDHPSSRNGPPSGSQHFGGRGQRSGVVAARRWRLGVGKHCGYLAAKWPNIGRKRSDQSGAPERRLGSAGIRRHRNQLLLPAAAVVAAATLINSPPPEPQISRRGRRCGRGLMPHGRGGSRRLLAFSIGHWVETRNRAPLIYGVEPIRNRRPATATAGSV